jgi:hypothetical protein
MTVQNSTDTVNLFTFASLDLAETHSLLVWRVRADAVLYNSWLWIVAKSIAGARNASIDHLFHLRLSSDVLWHDWVIILVISKIGDLS